MKKLIAICAVVLAAGAFADDSYLYWMLGDTLSWETGVSEPSYNAARVGVLSTDGTTTYLSLYDINANYVGDSTTKAYAFTSDAGTGTLAAQVASTYQATGYSFFIELLNDGTAVGRSSDSSMLQWNALSAYTGTTLGGISGLAMPGTAERSRRRRFPSRRAACWCFSVSRYRPPPQAHGVAQREERSEREPSEQSGGFVFPRFRFVV